MKRFLALTTALTLTVMFAATATAGAQESESDAPSQITVDYTPADGPADCGPTAFVASATIAETATSWTVEITARAPLCDTVTAAVYDMPDNRENPWPQTKVESTSFDIGVGVTRITFAKGCTPQQFDVVTGETPDVIDANVGPLTGPMLFLVPFTGYQSWDVSPNCSTTTTSTTSTSTTSTSTTSTSTTSTTEPPEVLGSTTIAPSTTVAVPVSVAGVSATNASNGTAAAAQLAFTGRTTQPLALLGVVAIALGAVLLVAVKRQRS